MTDSTNFITDNVLIRKPQTPVNSFYAVYNYCNSIDEPGEKLAFIEERRGNANVPDNMSNDEEYFGSLKDAKSYVNLHFQSGGEYFSLHQLSHPDNFLYILTDKIRYLMA